MSSYEPGPTEVRITLLFGNTIANPLYKCYVNSLDLKGNERVLDFGSGSGVCSKHPAASFDAILSHFVIHDIDAHERPGIVRHLARVLVDGGKVFVREPVGPEGISADDLCGLMRSNGLQEIDSRMTQVVMMGPTYEGVFHKTVR